MADPVIKKGSVYQRFNLKEMFGVDLSGQPELRRAVGQAIIDKIRERTKEGKAIGGNRDLKKPYSEEYQKSLEFKAAGKSKNDINMSLHGDMLNLMDIIAESSNTITIGWTDEKENLKAYNHNVGDTVPKRAFFGLNKTEMKEIARSFKSEVREARTELKKNGRDDFTERAMKFLDQLERIDSPSSEDE